MNEIHENASIRPLFRIIVPKFSKHNIFSREANKTIALSAIVIATVANKYLPWLEVEVIDENNYRSKLRGPIDPQGFPDHDALQRERAATFIGLCCSMTNAMPRALRLVEFYKNQPGIKGIIAGGWHVHYEPMEILNAGANTVVHGEGEAVICRILIALKENESIEAIPGISYVRDGKIFRNAPEQLLVENLEELPHPDFGLARYTEVTTFSVNRIRGCGGHCEFCSVKGRARFISPEKFLDNFKILISRGARDFFLVDDRTEEDRAGSLKFFNYLADYCEEKGIKITMAVQVRLSLAEDIELLTAMRRAGVTTVAIGYETPIVPELRAMKKPINPEKMLEWTRVFKRLGFFNHAMFIFGYPLLPEQLEQLEKEHHLMSARERANHLWSFMKKVSRAGADTIQILLLTPLLGTGVRERLAKQGRIYDFGWEYYDGTWLLFEPDKGIDPKKLQLEVTRLMGKFYAFNYLWRMRVVALLAHLAYIGFMSAVVYVTYFFTGFHYKPWYRKWRNSVIHFGAHLIIWKWLNNFKESKFIAKLRRMKQAR